MMGDRRERGIAIRAAVHEGGGAECGFADRAAIDEQARFRAGIDIDPRRQFHEQIVRMLAIDQRDAARRSEEHTSELQSLMRISYAVFCLKKKKNNMTYHMNRFMP